MNDNLNEMNENDLNEPFTVVHGTASDVLSNMKEFAVDMNNDKWRRHFDNFNCERERDEHERNARERRH